MKTNYIELNPARLDLPLAPCAVGQASSAVFTIGGDVPDDIAEMTVNIEYIDDDGETQLAVASGTLDESAGTYRVYFTPNYFPAASDALKYYIMGTDTEGNPRWLGTGNLRIFANPANGSHGLPPSFSRIAYAYDEATGLYYKVLAETNELGEKTLALDQEGVEL